MNCQHQAHYSNHQEWEVGDDIQCVGYPWEKHPQQHPVKHLQNSEKEEKEIQYLNCFDSAKLYHFGFGGGASKMHEGDCLWSLLRQSSHVPPYLAKEDDIYPTRKQDQLYMQEAHQIPRDLNERTAALVPWIPHDPNERTAALVPWIPHDPNERTAALVPWIPHDPNERTAALVPWIPHCPNERTAALVPWIPLCPNERRAALVP